VFTSYLGFSGNSGVTEKNSVKQKTSLQREKTHKERTCVCKRDTLLAFCTLISEAREWRSIMFT